MTFTQFFVFKTKISEAKNIRIAKTKKRPLTALRSCEFLSDIFYSVELISQKVCVYVTI